MVRIRTTGDYLQVERTSHIVSVKKHWQCNKMGDTHYHTKLQRILDKHNIRGNMREVFIERKNVILDIDLEHMVLRVRYKHKPVNDVHTQHALRWEGDRVVVVV